MHGRALHRLSCRRSRFLRNISASTGSARRIDDVAVEAVDLVKDFGDTRAVDGVTLAVPAGTIYGLLGPNGAGKTTTLRILLGIIDPSSGTRRVLGRDRPLEAAPEIGYLPEERGLYPAMNAREAIAFMGALRGLPIAEGRRRADVLLAEHNLGDWAKKPIRTLSKGMAQTVQLLGTIVHKPRLIVLDEPFAGLDAINQARLEELIRREARTGVTIIFSTHVIAHAERLCERIAIIAKGKVAFDGSVDEARAKLRPIVRLRTRASDGAVAFGHSRRRPPRGRRMGVRASRGRARAVAQGTARRRRRNRDAGDRAARPARRVRGDRRQSAPRRNGPGEARMMRFIRSAFVIARRDFAATVLSKAFIFFLLGPLFPLLLGGVFGGIGARVASQSEQPVVAVVSARRRISSA